MKYGKNNIKNRIKIDEIYEIARSKNFINKKELDEIKNNEITTPLTKFKKNKINSIFAQNFDDDEGCFEVNYAGIISSDSYFKYLEHIELEEARKNSREARNFSIVAITISVITIFFSYFLTNSVKVTESVEIQNPIEIKSDQINLIEQKTSLQEKKIDQIVENQEFMIKNLKVFKN